MAAFSYHSHVPFALDFAYPFELPPPSALQQAGDLASASSYLPCYYPEFGAMDDVLPVDISTVNAGTSSISAITTAAAATTPMRESSSSLDSGRTLASVDNNISSPSSSAQRRAAARTQRCLQKRKDRQRCNSESAQSKDSEAGGSRKLKKRSDVMKEAEKRKAPQEPPTGYIHVRARRGEATDSHSLAERVRREKIREKMKMLQDLIPGCDKLVGKALLLEEIINYVQSLQNQVEFLSMKLASMDPTLYDFGFHFEDYMIQPERPENMPLGLPNVQRTSYIQPAAFADPTNSYPVHDSSVPFLRHGEGHGTFPQDNGSNFVMHVGDQRQSLLSQVEFNSMSLQ